MFERKKSLSGIYDNRELMNFEHERGKNHINSLFYSYIFNHPQVYLRNVLGFWYFTGKTNLFPHFQTPYKYIKREHDICPIS